MSPRSEVQAHVCLSVSGAACWVLLQHSIMLRLFFIVEYGIACFLCAMHVLCVYSKFGHHPHPLGYLCAKFCFFCSLHCWHSPWIKNRILNHSITHPAYLMPRHLKQFRKTNSKFIFQFRTAVFSVKNDIKPKQLSQTYGLSYNIWNWESFL